MKKKVKVCVIGAGVLGLKAAHDLIHCSDSVLSSADVLVVEALDRLGGRIYTDRRLLVKGHAYDLGASWFHDSLANKVLHDAIEWKDPYQLNTTRDTYYNDGDPLVFCPEKMRPIDSKIQKACEDLSKHISMRYYDTLGEPDRLLQELAMEFQSWYTRFVLPQTADFAVRMSRVAELWFGISWDRISGKYAEIDHQGRDLFNVRGYDFIIDYLVSCLAPEIIVRNEPVRFIDYSQQNSIMVGTSSLEIECDYLVVTVPVSILQLDQAHANGILWSPPLPQLLQQALTTIHFGALGKVIFEFDKVWWDIGRDRFIVLGQAGSDNTVSTGSPPPSFTYPLVAFNSAVYNPDCTSLIILTQSPLTEYLESNPDYAWTYFEPMLKKLVVHENILTEPINTIVTDWTLHPWIRGSYTALETGDDALELIIRLLGEMQDMPGASGVGDERVRFAGEHTILEGAGCVHGAYCSGAREAQYIIEQIKQLR